MNGPPNYDFSTATRGAMIGGKTKPVGRQVPRMARFYRDGIIVPCRQAARPSSTQPKECDQTHRAEPSDPVGGKLLAKSNKNTILRVTFRQMPQLRTPNLSRSNASFPMSSTTLCAASTNLSA